MIPVASEDTFGGLPAAAPVDTHVVGVTIELPEPYRSELTSWRQRLGDPGAAKIPPHITLLPPTPMGDAELAKFCDHLAAVAAAHQPFTVRLAGAGTFRPTSPVVFVALAEGAPACARVQQDVVSGPVAPRLAFPYHPHVTVAHDLPEAQLDKAFTALSDYGAQFQAVVFDLRIRDGAGYWRAGREFRFGQPAVGLG